MLLFESNKLVLNIFLQYLLLTDADLIFQRPLYVCICICKGHHLPFGKQNRIHKHVCKYLLTSNSKKHHSSQIINVGSIKSKNSSFSSVACAQWTDPERDRSYRRHAVRPTHAGTNPHGAARAGIARVPPPRVVPATKLGLFLRGLGQMKR